MTINKLISQITKREGKKSEVKVGDVREVMSILAEIINEDTSALAAIIAYAEKKKKLFEIGR